MVWREIRKEETNTVKKCGEKQIDTDRSKLYRNVVKDREFNTNRTKIIQNCSGGEGN